MSERLLIVDDSEAVRQTYEAHFAACGFEVHCAASFKEAADRLASLSFSAVIVDVSLSSIAGSEGLAIAAYLRQMPGPPPVVVLTAYGEPQRAAAAARLGVDAFLHKPVSLVWLERLLRSRVEERRGGASLEPAVATG